MNPDLPLLFILPYLLLLTRVSAMLLAMPVIGWRSLPMVVRAGMALWVTVFFAITGLGGPTTVDLSDVGLVRIALLTVREIACGAALGLAIHFVFLAVQQAANIMAMQMGFRDAGIVDPAMGGQTSAITTLMEMSFALLFLAAGGHHLLIQIIARSLSVFPVGGTPDVAALADGLL